MNPRNHKFAERIKNFPSFTKCCTINWISEWPEEALRKVARGNLELTEVSEKTSVVEALKDIHKIVEEKTELYRKETGIDNHLSSTSYLELINTYKRLLSEKNCSNEESFVVSEE